MRHLRLIIIIVIVLGVILAAGWLYLRDGGEETQGIMPVVYVVGSNSAQPIRSEIHARGILESSVNCSVLAGMHGRILEFAPQGVPIKKGDVLIQLDDTFARENIENYEMNIMNLELNLVRQDAQLQLVEFEQTQNVNLSTARLEHAKLEQSYELSQPDQRQLRLMDIEEAIADLDAEDAKDEYEREKHMFEKGYLSEAALESYEQKYLNSMATAKEIKLENFMERKGATEERIVELKMNVQRAQHNKERAESRKQRRLADIQASINSLNMQIDLQKYLLNLCEEELKRSATRAEIDGVFIIEKYRDWTVGGAVKELNVGRECWESDILGHVIDTSKMDVRLVVHEADYHRLKAGLKVEVRMPAVPQKVYSGTLVQLGAIARDRNRIDPTAILGGNSDIPVFKAVINLNNDQNETFHPGMSAQVAIIIEELPENAITIPRAAITENTDGGFSVQKEDGTECKIAGRYFNEQYFLVTSGLANGDRILISPTRGGIL